MNVDLGLIRLRKPEPTDLEALYQQKNNPEVATRLVGFRDGYSRSDIAHWIELHSGSENEALYIITDPNDRCLGHVGLYQIDHRVRSAEFGIDESDTNLWGTGIGRACTTWALGYGFNDLALHRISLDVLETNKRALR